MAAAVTSGEVCSVCGEPRSAHVPTDAGPLTHPREARGEGRYVLVRAGYEWGGFMPGEGGFSPPVWRFEPAAP